MGLVQVFWYYINWHYTKAWSDILRIIANYLWFVGNFFSIELLAKTLFSPWKRLNISGGRNQEDSFFVALFINTLMRFIGFGVRMLTIIIGMIALIITAAISCVAVIVWFVFPAIFLFLFFAGLGYILNITF